MSVSNTADRRGDRRAETVPLVAEQEQRTSADGRARIQLHFPSSDLSVNVQNSPLQPEQRVRSPTHRRCLCGSQGALCTLAVQNITNPVTCHLTSSDFTSTFKRQGRVLNVRKSGLMSGSVLYPWPCGRISLVCGLLLLASSPLLTAGRMGNCSHPLVPEHGGFRCDPSPCRGFLHKSTIHLFCEPGYHIRSKYRVSKCRHGMWQPAIPTCVLSKQPRASQCSSVITSEGPNMNSDDRVNDSMPSMATTAGVCPSSCSPPLPAWLSIPPLPCQSHSRRSSDQLDLMADGLPVPLPSYEEAVYGSWGQRIPACSAPGPTQLLLAQESPSCHQSPQSDGSHHPLLSSQSPDNPPPPYEEVQSSHPRDRVNDEDVQQLHVTLSDDKDT
ncbi:Sushi domain-containing protein 4 Precursor [Larimichthys crocea]|uniref:Sushi domain-containing protein 4 n=1 Tax=Larimichthys crocea TaxID=215358 RepID=A0A6G0ITU7_LARCR|nr:Sushi domain-containing protein 4 Precursor [Larimichthys crocea]